MVSFLTSISSNDYARLRSRIYVLGSLSYHATSSCIFYVQSLFFLVYPFFAMTNDDTYMACYPTIVQYAVK